MKQFKNKVRWDFSLTISGYGRNVYEALKDAMMHSSMNWPIPIEMYSVDDLDQVERFEVLRIAVDDIRPEGKSLSDEALKAAQDDANQNRSYYKFGKEE